MATGDMFLLTLTASRVGGGDIMQNVFGYQQLDGLEGSSELANEFIEENLPSILAIVSEQTTFTGVSCINLNDPTDFASITLTGNAGEGNGDPMPPFVSWTFEYVRADRTVRNGRKAFGLVPEVGVTDGVVDPAWVTFVNATATALAGDLDSEGDGSSWRPRIYRRPGTYSSGVVAAPGAMYPIQTVSYSSVSTQNSRKFGRGV